MINYDSILSAFDGKPTLLQWLKLVKKALDESVLKDITLRQDGANVVFTFNFEDGTSISTPAVTLPKGDTGAKGDKGDKGEQGVSITGVDEVSNEVVGGQTLTTLRFNFSNGTNNEVVVHAENGKNASGGKLYLHDVTIKNNSGAALPIAKLKYISTDNTKFSFDKFNFYKCFDAYANDNSMPPKFYGVKDMSTSASSISITYYTTYPFSVTSTATLPVQIADTEINDNIFEL